MFQRVKCINYFCIVPKTGIFTFGVDENVIGVGVCQKTRHKFALANKRLTRAGHTENHRVAVDELASVDNNQIFADAVLSEIHAVRVIDFLCAERGENGKAVGGQGTHHVDFAHAVGQDGVQTVPLLKAQLCHTRHTRAGKNESMIFCILSILMPSTVVLSVPFVILPLLE